jgi:type II secretory ATPase GspE/PulE/Tfp pilus assembly ATPase PilB-like protein
MENWPLPPFFKETDRPAAPPPMEAMIFAPSGAVAMGQLLSFEPVAGVLGFKPRGEGAVAQRRFESIKSIQLVRPLALEPDQDLIQRYQLSGGQTVAPAERPFSVHFIDGESLQGRTKGFVKTSHGLYVYLSTAGERAVPIFVPESAFDRYHVGELLGQQLRDTAMVSPESLELALTEQRKRRQLMLDTHLKDIQPEALAKGADSMTAYEPVNLGEILMDQGLVSKEQLAAALSRMSGEKKNLLGQILVEMGALTRTHLTHAVAEQLNIPAVKLRNFLIAPEVISLVPKTYAFSHHVLPILLTEKSLIVALESPLDADYLDELRASTQRQIVPVVANPEELSARIAVEYANVVSRSNDATIEAEIEQLSQQIASGVNASSLPGMRQQVSETDTILVRLVNKMIEDAYKAGASDIHVEAYPDEQPTRLRFRIDGILTDYMRLPYTLRAAIISRLKIMANLDISEHRKPQDGKIDFSRFAPVKLELRVASLPTANNLEDIVMRLLASSKPVPMADLGFNDDLAASLKKMVHRSYGLILVCGPTGSGKTTTLHSLLAEVNTAENKIWTAEDPIEITHPGLRQIQMVPRAGLTFASAMRAFLRADPDIIMVGEMRDAETTHIAIEASLTGHLVLSTLHTNSAPESVVRLLDMGLDPFSFSDALIGVLSQRLARRLCKHCKTPRPDSAKQIEEMAQAYCQGTTLQPQEVLADWHQRFASAGGGPPLLYTAPGCAKCNHTGHKGRVGIYELMVATPAIKKLVQSRAPVATLFQCAKQEGMLTLQQYGLLKVMGGQADLTSVRSACA